MFDRDAESLITAPSRINLIGEHIDYCGGHVLPMAIDGGTRILAAANDSNSVNVFTERFADRVSLEIRDDHTPGNYGDWRDYVAGVISLLQRHDQLTGADLYVVQSSGTAGLSSSASFCLALSRALRAEAERVELAKICQQVEHHYAGVQCGIMDQMSIAIGGIIYLDCRSLRWREAGVLSDDICIVVLDTAKARTLAASAYNERVEELHQIADSLGLPNINSLVNAPASEFLPDVLSKRYRHVVSEEKRVADAFDAIANRDWQLLGQLMCESHASLRDDYEVSCRELDTIVELALKQEGVLGARMTGGGFGGCAIALAEKRSVDDWLPKVAREYEAKTGLKPRLFRTETSVGLSRSQF